MVDPCMIGIMNMGAPRVFAECPRVAVVKVRDRQVVYYFPVNSHRNLRRSVQELIENGKGFLELRDRASAARELLKECREKRELDYASALSDFLKKEYEVRV